MSNFTESAYAGGMASEGEKLARLWCANCHVVSEGQQNANADVPSFREIAKRHETNLDALGAFLADPHPVMPDFSLTRREIQDLLAYIGSLKSN